MSLTETERRVVDEIERRTDELVALAADLIRFDTTARDPSDPPRDEMALQSYLADRMRALGADIDLWEPAPDDVGHSRLTPPGLSFEGRPQLAARFRGAGRGPTLLFNGHIDTVSTEPRARWKRDPHRPDVLDGKLYGRGACDMKGGIASMVFAAELLASLGLRLTGDLVVCTVTDEESTGAGGLAAVVHGVRADAGVVTEPSAFDVWVACRGSLIPTITVPGRPGHAGVKQPHWREGGAVNAVDKAHLVMDAMRRFQEDWRAHRNHHHPYLSQGEVVLTGISSGEWAVTYPAACQLVYHVAYLPQHADEGGWGTEVRQQITDWIHRVAVSDPWLSENPPVIEWAPEVPAAEVSIEEPIVRMMLTASADAGRLSKLSGLDSWHDGATFTRFGGTPAICFGPGDISVAHTINEFVPVDDLVDCAKALALVALRFCSPAEK